MANIKNDAFGSSRMTALPRMKIIAACVGVALAQWGAGSAFADTAVGVDTALGNVMSPPGRSSLPRQVEPDGYDTVRHSPTGQLYGLPMEEADDQAKTASGWQYTGGVDIGALGGDADTKATLYRKYKDLKKGAYLDYFSAEGQKTESAQYFQAFGGGVGRDDQFYGVQFGRYNDYRVKLFFNETKHVFTDNYKAIYNGAGTGNLTLAGGLQPNGGALPYTTALPTAGNFLTTAGGTVTIGGRAYSYVPPPTNAAAANCSAAAPCWLYGSNIYNSASALAGINWTGTSIPGARTPTTAALPQTPQAIAAGSIAGNVNGYLAGVPGDTELSLVRKKGGVMVDLRLTDFWKGYASYTQERRTGARPFGMTENNYDVEIPEPVDYTTHDLLAGLSYMDSLNQANIRASASVFRNNISTLTVQQPWLSTNTGLGAIQTAIFDLYPDNKAFNLKGEYARNLPDFYKGRFTANAAWGTSRQDDALQMPVDPTQTAQYSAAMGSTLLVANNPGYATTTPGIDLRNWDGTNGSPLSQSSAKQRIDTRLVNFGLSLKPVDALDVKGDVRLYETANKGGYVAYNPLTGQFGRGFIRSTSFDLAVGSSGTPGATGVPCYTLPGFPVVPGCVFNGNLGGIAQTGGGTASINNPGNVPVFSNPRDYKQYNYALSADYDFGHGRSVNGLVEREEFRRTYREREKTWDDKLKLGYVNRGFETATLRTSYEISRRRGTDYQFWPVADFATGLPGLDWNTIYSMYIRGGGTTTGWTNAALTGAATNLAGYVANRYNIDSRKHDQADRNQQILNTRVNFMPRSDVDLAVMVQWKDVTYPNSSYGMDKDRQTSANLEANYQPSADQQLYSYYSWQEANKSMRASAGFNAAGAAPTCTTTVNSALTLDQFVAQCATQFWLPSARWTMDTRDTNDVLGLGFQTALGRMKLGIDYTLSQSKTRYTYSYGPYVSVATVPQQGLGAFPDMTLVQNTLVAHLLVPIQRSVSAHLLYRHESARVQDWHYTGLPVGASAAENQATLLLDAGAQNYHVNIYGLMFQFKL
jgi:hypothetical protein